MGNKVFAIGGGAAVLITALISGCSQQTLDSARQDADKNVKVVQREAKRAERKARPQLNRASVGARVTAALKANENLKGSSIRADVDTEGDSIKLRGTVKTATQKTLAGRVARDTLGPDKSVKNELTVTGE